MILMNPTGAAEFSPCGRYRYVLERRWGDGPCALWVCCNPSSAGATDEDHTTRKIRGFSERADCESFVLINLHARIATDPKELERAARAGEDIRGPHADERIARLLKDHRESEVIFAWGDVAISRPAIARTTRTRVEAIASFAASRGIRPRCLGLTRRGQPRHPLMVSYATRLEWWETRR